MIPLTRLNGKQLWLNTDLVQWVEESPDCILTLVTGEKIVVAESLPEVLRLLEAGRRPVPHGTAAVAHAAALAARELAET